jgi:hypothetical protein
VDEATLSAVDPVKVLEPGAVGEATEEDTTAESLRTDVVGAEKVAGGETSDKVSTELLTKVVGADRVTGGTTEEGDTDSGTDA